MRGAFLQDATLSGPESRGSSPVRIPRDERTRECPTVAGFTLAAKGPATPAASSGAAVDGLSTARAIAARYAITS